MNYSIRRALSQLVRNRTVYLLLLIEMTVALTAIWIGANVQTETLVFTKRLQEQICADEFSIEASQSLARETHANYLPLLSVESFLALQARYASDVKMSYIAYHLGGTPVLYLSPSAHEKIAIPTAAYSDEMQSDELKEILFLRPFLSPAAFDVYAIALLQENGADVPWTCVLLLQPINISYEMFEQIKADILSFLHEQSIAEEYQFSSTDINSAYRRRIRELTDQARLIAWVASIVLLILLVGTCGYLLLLIYRRKYEFAIALAVGASRNRLIIEVYLEVFLLTAMAGLLSFIASRFFMSSFDTAYFEVHDWPSTFGLVAGLCVSMSALPTLVSVYAMRNIYPRQLLGEQ